MHVQRRDSRDDLWDALEEGLTGELLNRMLKTCSRWAEQRRVMGRPSQGRTASSDIPGAARFTTAKPPSLWP